MLDVHSALRDARARSFDLTLDLDDAAWLGPRLAIVNPIRWELAHVGWFQEHWVLRHAAGRAPILPRGDALYDSAKVPHDTRWDLPLLSRDEVLAYLAAVLDASLALEPSYFHELALFHEDMHGEAFAYTRQTLDLPAPRFVVEAARPVPAGPLPGDVGVPGGRYRVGAEPGQGFTFDNEKWAHEVAVAPFHIARAPVTNAEFATFVDAGGYGDARLWSETGWRARTVAGAEHPMHFRRGADGGWRLRRFGRDVALPPDEPVVHVSWFEADAFCRWAGRRLPTEAEWELAASGFEKRRFPWGDDPTTNARANVDGAAGGPIDVAALPDGDSPFGCRQMIGNTWEWTSTRFAPFPGFVVDPYEEYSEPWFHTPHMVLRGGAWVTRGRLLRSTWRNFYPPDRRDVFAGFRTVAPG